MIKVNSITITEFRGIRDLTLNFNGANFAVCGPNGTGKSGIVDALEFALTGNVSRLSGEGRGEVSVKDHGPHVDHRDNPEKAKVSVTVSIPSLGKVATIERSPKNPSAAKITPSDPAIEAVFRQAKEHPEIVLSRRELIKYVLATPGDRAREVQTLLHLEQIEQVRGNLLKIANQLEKQLSPLKVALSQSKQNLLQALNITNLTKDNVLAATNVQREILGLTPLTELSPTISLKDGLATAAKPQAQRIVKSVALADLGSTTVLLTELSSSETSALAVSLLSDLKALASNPLLAKSVKCESFYKAGLELVEADLCPLCDTQWEIETIRKHVQDKIDQLAEITKKRRALESRLEPLITLLRKIKSSVATLAAHAKLATPPLTIEDAQQLAVKCGSAADNLDAFLPLDSAIAALEQLTAIPQGARDRLKELETFIKGLPEPTKHDAARDWLTLAQERLEVWREAGRKLKVAEKDQQTARTIYDTYAKTSDFVLQNLYDAVQGQFSDYYRFVNHGDEDAFNARLVPSMGKLGFDVDFYGRGFFPPGAYHSEGHQDGMGLCLYLALMNHLHGENFTFSVLDDVLMSVDVGHRREVCRLLKKHFPNTQFVMTTHDQVWLKHMKTEKLIGGRVQFKSWSVDSGPMQWDDREDVWKEIADHLSKNDVREAAALLRHYLEYMSAELCDRLRARVEFRGDAQYQLGELLPSAIARFKELHKKAKEAANSWNQKDLVSEISTRDTSFGVLATASNAEQWQVNSSVHFNGWADMVKEDFAPVVDAFKNLIAGFSCSKCEEYLYVSPERESPECLRCGCNQTNLNLLKKSD